MAVTLTATAPVGVASWTPTAILSPSIVLNATFGVPSGEVGNTITIGLFLLDADGNPLTAARRVECLLYDTALAGDMDLATNAVFSAVGGGATAIAGVGTNRVVLTTDATGYALLSVLDAQIETVYGTAVTPRGPLTTPTIVWQSAQFTMAFT